MFFSKKKLHIFYAVILVQECTPVEKGQLYYEFQHNTRSVKSTILHFQVSYDLVFVIANVSSPFFIHAIHEVIRHDNRDSISALFFLTFCLSVC